MKLCVAEEKKQIVGNLALDSTHFLSRSASGKLTIVTRTNIRKAAIENDASRLCGTNWPFKLSISLQRAGGV
jgi:hypothetical protein